MTKLSSTAQNNHKSLTTRYRLYKVPSFPSCCEKGRPIHPGIWNCLVRLFRISYKDHKSEALHWSTPLRVLRKPSSYWWNVASWSGSAMSPGTTPFLKPSSKGGPHWYRERTGWRTWRSGLTAQHDCHRWRTLASAGFSQVPYNGGLAPLAGQLIWWSAKTSQVMDDEIYIYWGYLSYIWLILMINLKSFRNTCIVIMNK